MRSVSGAAAGLSVGNFGRVVWLSCVQPGSFTCERSPGGGWAQPDPVGQPNCGAAPARGHVGKPTGPHPAVHGQLRGTTKAPKLTGKPSHSPGMLRGREHPRGAGQGLQHPAPGCRAAEPSPALLAPLAPWCSPCFPPVPCSSPAPERVSAPAPFTAAACEQLAALIEPSKQAPANKKKNKKK